jgi:hypothetical protein
MTTRAFTSLLCFFTCLFALISLACMSSAPTPLPPTQPPAPSTNPAATETPIPTSPPTVTPIPTEPPLTATATEIPASPTPSLRILDFRQRGDTVLIFDLLSPEILYARSKFGHGTYQSTDGGTTWALVKPDPGLDEIQRSLEGGPIWRDPQTSTTLYGVNEATLSFVKSVDGGQSWVPLMTPFEATELIYMGGILEFDPWNPNALFVTTMSAMYKSSDAGETWHKVRGLPEPGPSGLNFTQFIFDPSASSIVYVLDQSWGAFKSTDSGENWVSLSHADGQNSFYARWLVIDPTNPDMLYAANNTNGKTYISSEGGQTWVETDFGLPAGDLFAFALDPLNPATRYAILASGEISGLFKSTDGGQMWDEIAAVLLP